MPLPAYQVVGHTRRPPFAASIHLGRPDFGKRVKRISTLVVDLYPPLAPLTVAAH